MDPIELYREHNIVIGKPPASTTSISQPLDVGKAFTICLTIRDYFTCCLYGGYSTAKFHENLANISAKHRDVRPCEIEGGNLVLSPREMPLQLTEMLELIHLPYKGR